MKGRIPVLLALALALCSGFTPRRGWRARTAAGGIVARHREGGLPLHRRAQTPAPFRTQISRLADEGCLGKGLYARLDAGAGSGAQYGRTAVPDNGARARSSKTLRSYRWISRSGRRRCSSERVNICSLQFPPGNPLKPAMRRISSGRRRSKCRKRGFTYMPGEKVRMITLGEKSGEKLPERESSSAAGS